MAHSFQIAPGSDPQVRSCIIVPLRKNDKPICEVVLSAEQTLTLMQYVQDALYARVVEDDDG